MKILIWHSKYGNVYVSARTPEEEKRAWLYLFECMDDNEFYCDLEDNEIEAYVAAKDGDAKAARWLLGMRSDGEYAQITFEYPVEP